MSDVTAELQPARKQHPLVTVLAFVAGALLAWLGLLASLWLPTDNLGVELAAASTLVSLVAWRTHRWSRPFALVLALAGVVTLVFLGWLLWDLGTAMSDFE